MLWYVEEHKPAAIRRREDLDCLIAGVHFDANLSVFKINFASTTIAAVDDGVRHVSGSPWRPAKKQTFLNLAPEHLVVAWYPKNVRLDINDPLKSAKLGRHRRSAVDGAGDSEFPTAFRSAHR
jgi:hypothetical protein